MFDLASFILCFSFEIRGQALVDVLFGKYNPSGRLPITYPKYNHRLSTYDYKWTENSLGNTIDVEFEFGHGLSYTTFAYSNLTLSPDSSLPWNEQLFINLNVKNVGSVLGDHTVLLFVTDAYRSITPPNKELKGYQKLTLAPDEERSIQFQLNRTDLSFIGLNNTRQSEPGLFTVTIGNLQSNFTLLPEKDNSVKN